MLYIYEHPASGVLLHVDYTPASSADDKVTINDVHVADATYRAVGPSLLGFMHGTFDLNTSTHPAVATRLLEHVAQELACQKKH
jgi:hypothetical protein